MTVCEVISIEEFLANEINRMKKEQEEAWEGAIEKPDEDDTDIVVISRKNFERANFKNKIQNKEVLQEINRFFTRMSQKEKEK